MRKNILLFILVLSISFATASYFGNFYNKFSPQYGDWLNDRESAINFAGFLMSYIFFVPFIFKLLSTEKNNRWILWLTIPILLFLLSADKDYFYIPLSLSIIGFLLGKVINLIISKFQHPKPPMVIK